MHMNFLVLDCSLLHIYRNTFTHQKMLFLTLQISCRFFSKCIQCSPLFCRGGICYFLVYMVKVRCRHRKYSRYTAGGFLRRQTTPESQQLLKNKVSFSLMHSIHPGLAGGPSLHYCFALEIVLILSFPWPKLIKWPHLILFG